MPYFGEDHFLSQQSAKEIMVELDLFVSQWLLLASDQQCRRKYRINHDYIVSHPFPQFRETLMYTMCLFYIVISIIKNIYGALNLYTCIHLSKIEYLTFLIRFG